ITIQGGDWDGNGTKQNLSFCIFKLAHAQNIVLSGCTFKNDVEGHMVEVGAVNNLTVKNCTFKDHISLDSSYEHEEALQLDVNLYETTEMGNFDKYQNKNITVTGCNFNNVGRGVGSHNSIEGMYFTNMHIDNNTFTNVKSYAVACVNYRNSTIKNNKMNSCGGGILFMNIKNNYKTCTNSYVMKDWNLKLNTSKDNSVISGNTIKQSKNNEDKKCIIIFGDQVPEDYSNRYIKGDHCINGVTFSNNTIYSPQYTAVLVSDAKNCKINNNNIYYTGKGGKCYGIFMKNKCDNTSVTGNRIDNCFDGITTTDCKSLSVSSNTITSSQRNGITFIGTTKSKVTKNKITGSGTGKSYGIFIEKKSNGTSVTNNVLNKCYDGIITTSSNALDIS
ncbi:MAG: right-handed parallel beta-helix repeat-containing protein, partial [Ruminococcus sp.]